MNQINRRLASRFVQMILSVILLVTLTATLTVKRYTTMSETMETQVTGMPSDAVRRLKELLLGH